MKLKNIPMFLCYLALSAVIVNEAIVAMASPITVDEIDSGSQSSGITINSGRAVITVPSGTEVSQMMTTKNAVTVSNKTYDESSNIQKQCRAIYDFAVAGGATMVALPCSIPANSVITNAWLDVKTTMAATPASGTATFGIGLAASSPSKSDLSGMIPITGLTAGLYQLVPHGTTSTIFKLTAATSGFFKFADDNGSNPTPTAGYATLFIDYLISN